MRRDCRHALLALLLPLVAAAAAPEHDYAWAFALHTPEPADAYRVQFTLPIYSASWPPAGLRDIVVVDANGQVVPFARMRAIPAGPLPFELKTQMLRLPENGSDVRPSTHVAAGSDGTIVIQHANDAGATTHPQRWLIDAGRRVALDSIELVPEPGDPDFELHVTVEASDDLQQWRPLVGDAVWLSLQRHGGQVQRLRIGVHGGPARYYRLRLLTGKPPWPAAQAPAVVLSGHESEVAHVTEPAHTLTLQGVPVETGDAPAHSYEYRFPALIPVDSLRLILPDATSAAHASVTVRDPLVEQERWIGLGKIDALRVHGSASGKLRFVDQRRLGRVRVQIDTELSRPPQLEVSWRPDVFVFLAQGQGPYRLLAGSRTARRGLYPVTAALKELRQNKPVGWQPPMATPGPRMRAAGLAALDTPFDWTRVLLWAVLVAGGLLVIALGIGLLRQRRQGIPD